jgi:Zn finger protein HypA/HybF involved in hydrogenase expression
MSLRPSNFSNDTKCLDCEKIFPYIGCENNKCPHCQSTNIKVTIRTLVSKIPLSVQELQELGVNRIY